MAEKDILQDSLLREIDDELRHERYAKLWKKYGNFIIGAALALVLGVAAFKGWQYWDIKTRTEQGDRFAAALELAGSGELTDARKAFTDLAKDANQGYAILARFQNAAILAKDGQKREALQAYRAIADDSNIGTNYRDVALVLSGYLALEIDVFGDLEARIDQLSKDAGPWRPLARELLALSAYKKGEVKAARDIYQELSQDAEAPAAIRSRAALMLDVLAS